MSDNTLYHLRVPELRRIARKMGIAKSGSLNKPELVRLITLAQSNESSTQALVDREKSSQFLNTVPAWGSFLIAFGGVVAGLVGWFCIPANHAEQASRTSAVNSTEKKSGQRSSSTIIITEDGDTNVSGDINIYQPPPTIQDQPQLPGLLEILEPEPKQPPSDVPDLIVGGLMLVPEHSVSGVNSRKGSWVRFTTAKKVRRPTANAALEEYDHILSKNDFGDLQGNFLIEPRVQNEVFFAKRIVIGDHSPEEIDDDALWDLVNVVSNEFDKSRRIEKVVFCNNSDCNLILRLSPFVQHTNTAVEPIEIGPILSRGSKALGQVPVGWHYAYVQYHSDSNSVFCIPGNWIYLGPLHKAHITISADIESQFAKSGKIRASCRVQSLEFPVGPVDTWANETAGGPTKMISASRLRYPKTLGREVSSSGAP